MSLALPRNRTAPSTRTLPSRSRTSSAKTSWHSKLRSISALQSRHPRVPPIDLRHPGDAARAPLEEPSGPPSTGHAPACAAADLTGASPRGDTEPTGHRTAVTGGVLGRQLAQGWESRWASPPSRSASPRFTSPACRVGRDRRDR